MDCNNLNLYITPQDFSCVGNVAQHCDLEKLCIATEEAKNFDLIPLFCYDFISDILDNWNLADNDESFTKYQKLICGGSYVYDGKTYMNFGLKQVWVYYSYARYLLINQFNDTANGTVTKQNEWSIPTPLKEVTDFSNKYRSMGKDAYESVLLFLRINIEQYPKFEGCNSECGDDPLYGAKKLTGFKFSTVGR